MSHNNRLMERQKFVMEKNHAESNFICFNVCAHKNEKGGPSMRFQAK